MKIKPSFRAPLLITLIFAMTLSLRYLPSVNDQIGVDNRYVVLLLLSVLIMVLPGIFYCKLCGCSNLTSLGFRFAKGDRIGLGVLLFFLTILGNILIKVGLVAITGSFESNSVLGLFSYVSESNLSTVTDTVYSLLAFAVIPAVCSEFVFRGILLCEYRKGNHGVLGSILISAFLYALFGFSVKNLGLLFFFGVMLGVMMCCTESLLFCMLSAALSFSVDLFGDRLLEHIALQKVNRILIFLGAGTLFLFFLFLIFREAQRVLHNQAIGIRPKPQTWKIEPTPIKAVTSAFLSPFLLSCIAVFLISVFFR